MKKQHEDSVCQAKGTATVPQKEAAPEGEETRGVYAAELFYSSLGRKLSIRRVYREADKTGTVFVQELQ